MRGCLRAHTQGPHPERGGGLKRYRSGTEEYPTRAQAAEDAGYVAHPDDNLPPAQHLLPGEGVDPLTAFAACVEAARINNERTWL